MKRTAVLILLAVFMAVCSTPICAGWLDEIETDSTAPSKTDSRDLMAANSKEVATNEELFNQIVTMVQGVDLKFEPGDSSGRSDCTNHSDKCKVPKDVDTSSR